jgi:signal transduction histidine kinase
MRYVKIGRRLVFVLLLAMTPVIAVYTYWSAQWSRRNYIADLKRETRATTRALAPVVSGYIQRAQWKEVHQMLQRMSADGTDGAVLHSDGTLWYAVAELPRGLTATAMHGLRFAIPELPRSLTANGGNGDNGTGDQGFDFEQSIAPKYWFCRIVPLSNGSHVIGYLLVAQDWTDIDEDIRERMLPPIGAALLVTALIALLIPTLVARYVSRPLAELSRRVFRFSGIEQPGKNLANNEVELLSEEFQRLDQRLVRAHQDLVERHRYELELDRRLQRADRLATIGTLASGLAHEIGTPMAVIRTRAELLLENANNDKAREGLEIILSQIDRISRIVQMLLDYARNREPVRARHDIRTIIEHVLKLVETEARRRQVRIVVEPNDEPLTVECDAEQLQQVFINLAVNAFDAMAPNGGTLRVSTAVESKTDHSPLVKLTFEDNGSGVPPQVQQHVFDPFFTTKPPGKGTGMGLSVSQAIILDHNGEISFESQRSGTRFYIRIPVAQRTVAADINGEGLVERAL